MTTEGLLDPAPLPRATPTVLYQPSWVDRTSAWIDRLPGPAWAVYLSLIVALNLLNAALEWRAGSYPVGTFYPLHIVAMSAGVTYLATIHYLDRAALLALMQFRPALAGEGPRLDELAYRLTTMPARPTLAATLFGLLYGLVVNYSLLQGVVLPDSWLIPRPPLSGWTASWWW